jgi:hypothetical protein
MNVVSGDEIILSIDPGPEYSGLVIYQNGTVCAAGDIHNEIIGSFLDGYHFFDSITHGYIKIAECTGCVIEDIVFQGQMVGKSVFETAKKIGDFRTAWRIRRDFEAKLMPRNDVLNYLCGSSHFRDPKTGRLKRLTDSKVKRAIMAKFPETGGGASPQIGTKKQPGPLYIMKGLKHAWSALGLAITFAETRNL